MPRVSIITGSESDMPVMRKACETLAKFEIEYEINVCSAHRAHGKLVKLVSGAEGRGVCVFICGAGMAAHLAGVVASLTARPVIGVPILSKHAGGLDALLSTVQMPKGVPVATVAIDGAENAALLAAQILSLADNDLAEKFKSYKLMLGE